MKKKAGLTLSLLLLLSWGLSATGCFSSMERAAPPERAASPEQILPPEVFRETKFAHGEVIQVVLDLNPQARHQFGYDFEGSRMAIFTILDGSEYDRLFHTVEDAYRQALEDDSSASPPKYLDDVGDGAVVYGSSAIFKKEEACGIIFANTFLDAGGEPVIAVTPEELEKLVSIAASRM